MVRTSYILVKRMSNHTILADRRGNCGHHSILVLSQALKNLGFQHPSPRVAYQVLLSKSKLKHKTAQSSHALETINLWLSACLIWCLEQIHIAQQKLGCMMQPSS